MYFLIFFPLFFILKTVSNASTRINPEIDTTKIKYPNHCFPYQQIYPFYREKKIKPKASLTSVFDISSRTDTQVNAQDSLIEDSLIENSLAGNFFEDEKKLIGEFFKSIKNGDLERTKDFLTEKNVPINAKNSMNMQCLYYANFICKNNREKMKEMVEYLINQGAEIEALDDFGRTPLMWACLNQNTSLIEIILKNMKPGDDIKIMDKNALSLFDFVQYKGYNEEITNLLESKIEKFFNPCRELQINNNVNPNLSLSNFSNYNLQENIQEFTPSFLQRIYHSYCNLYEFYENEIYCEQIVR